MVVLVRGGALTVLHDRLSADPDGYRALAVNLAEHGVLGRVRQPSAYRPPLYPVLLTPCVAGAWKPETAIAALHFALGLATVWITVRLGRRWGLGGFSFLAGGLVACDPILLHHSTLVMTETLATFLAVVSLAVVSAAAEAKGRTRTVLAGLAGASFALAALCRPVFFLSLLFTAAALAAIQTSWRQRLHVVAAMGVAASVVLLPWATRNFFQLGKPIVTTTHGGYTLLLANNPMYYEFLRTAPGRSVWSAAELDALLRQSRLPDEVSNDRHEYELAWQTIRRHPGMFLYASLLRLGSLWGVLPHATAQPESSAARSVRYAVAGWYIAVFGLAVAAVCLGEVRLIRPPWLWATVLAASFTAAHFAYWTDLRMRAPLAPAISLVAAAAARRLAWHATRKFISASGLSFERGETPDTATSYQPDPAK